MINSPKIKFYDAVIIAVNHDEFKQKIEATIGEMEDIFKQNINKERYKNKIK